MKQKPVKKPRVKRYTVALSEREVRRLTLYAEAEGTDRPTALHRLVALSLRSAVEEIPQGGRVAVNQLGLFDSVQIDIFNNTHKVNNQD